MRRPVQRREQGSITILAAALLITLFGLAALAVDVGYLYTRSRMMSAVADSAVAAGMNDLIAGNQTNAKSDATNLANANGAGYTVSATTPSSSQLSVQLTATYPLRFGGILGISSRTLSVTAIGQSSPANPALLALGGCGSGGLRLTGNTLLTVNGNVESNGPLDYSMGPNPTTTNGYAESPCVGNPSGVRAGVGGDSVTGGTGVGGPFTDPFASAQTSLPACTYGSLSAPYTIPNVLWGAGGVLAPGVYCSGGQLNVASIDACTCIVADGVSFIATGAIIVGSNSASTFSPAAGMPDNLIAYSEMTGSCSSAGPAINIGFQGLTLNGSIYAPNGCINVGSNAAVTITGSLIGNEVDLGMGPNVDWTIGVTGGAGGGSWQMLQ